MTHDLGHTSLPSYQAHAIANLISATDGQDAQTYFTYDGLGSVTDVTDENGDVVDGYSYAAFGAIRSQSGAPALHNSRRAC
jgi:YD repeat-containing protein